MLCLKRFPLVIASLLSVFVFSLFFFSSGHVYASSYSFSYDSVSNPIPPNTTYDSTLIGFVPSYVSVEVSNFDGQGYFSPFSILLPVNGTYPYSLANDSNLYSFGVAYLPANVLYYRNYFYGRTYSLTLTFYDSNPLVSTPCPDCPPIPETQYGDVLDKIYKAILFVPAMAFVLYLFYILFAWYVGGRK